MAKEPDSSSSTWSETAQGVSAIGEIAGWFKPLWPWILVGLSALYGAVKGISKVLPWYGTLGIAVILALFAGSFLWFVIQSRRTAAARAQLQDRPTGIPDAAAQDGWRALIHDTESRYRQRLLEAEADYAKRLAEQTYALRSENQRLSFAKDAAESQLEVARGSLDSTSKALATCFTERAALQKREQARVYNDSVMNAARKQQEPKVIQQLRAENADLRQRLAEAQRAPQAKPGESGA